MAPATVESAAAQEEATLMATVAAIPIRLLHLDDKLRRVMAVEEQALVVLVSQQVTLAIHIAPAALQVIAVVELASRAARAVLAMARKKHHPNVFLATAIS